MNFLREYLTERRRRRERRRHKEVIARGVYYDPATLKQGIDQRKGERRNDGSRMARDDER